MKKIIVLLAVAALMLAMAGTAQAAVLFSVDHDNLPAVGNPVLTWDGFTKRGGAPTVVELRGEKWYSNKYATVDAMISDTGDHAFGDNIPINGATIVTAVKPERTTGGDWCLVVDIFYDQLCLGINNVSGKVTVKVSGASAANSTWEGGVIPEEPGVLTLTVGNEANPAFEVFWQGVNDLVPVSMGTGNGNTGGQPYTALYPHANYRYFAGYINLGRNNPDGWSTYNGLIGDTYVYDEQLSGAALLTAQKKVLAAMGIQGINTTPVDGDLEVNPVTLTELSWRLPAEFNVGTKVNVWFGLEQIPANQIVTDEIGTTSITLDAAGIVLEAFTDYTWHLELIGPNDAIQGNQEVQLINNTYTFTTLSMNQVPSITADSLGYQWLEDGTKTVGLTYVVADEDGTALHTYTWSVVSGPDGGATFADDVNLDTDVTFTADGDYVLQVEVNDTGEFYITDTVTVHVYEDGCKAAKAELPYYKLDARAKGDTNYDCEVNLADFAALALNWLAE